MKRTKTIGFAVGGVISLGCLYYVFRGVTWGALEAEFRRVNLLYLPVSFIVTIFSVYVRAVRWRWLLPASKDGAAYSTKHLYDATVLGAFATTLLPLRAGEFIRPFLLSRTQPVSFSGGFASIVTERVFDLLAMFLLLGLCLTQVEAAPPMVLTASKGLAIIAGAIMAMMFVAYLWPGPITRLMRWCTTTVLQPLGRGLAMKIGAMGEEFIVGLRAISSVGDLVLILVSSVLIWLSYAAVYQSGMWLFGYFPSFWVGVTVVSMTALAVALPSAPGFLGPYQVGCSVALFTIYRYPENFVASYSLLLWFIQTAYTILLGLHVLRSRGLSFRKIVAEAQSDS